MGGRVMVNVVKGMSGGLAGNHATHDQETGQNSKNEYCAGYTSHECITLKFSIGQEPRGVKHGGGLQGKVDLLYAQESRVSGWLIS